MSIVYGPKLPFYSCWDYIALFGTGFMQVMYLGRAPRTKETLPDFSEVASGNPTSTCISRVDGQSMDPRVWGVTAWCQSLGIRIPWELGFGIHHH